MSDWWEQARLTLDALFLSRVAYVVYLIIATLLVFIFGGKDRE